MTYTVRSGTTGDLPAVLSLINQAAGWLRTKGTDQWAAPWPNEDDRDERVLRGLVDGRTWIIDDNDKIGRADYLPAATISCRWDAPPKLWNELAISQPAVYVSRLIVNRDYKDRKLGEEMLAWAGKWARIQYGALWIRIDVWTTNTKLHTYYQAIGFEPVGYCQDVDYPSAALFQRSTKDLEWAVTPRLTEQPELITPFLPVDIGQAAQDQAAGAYDHAQCLETHAAGLTPARNAPRCTYRSRGRQPRGRLVRACASVASGSLFRRLRRCVGRTNTLTRLRKQPRSG